MDGRSFEMMDGWIDWWMDGWMDKWMDGLWLSGGSVQIPDTAHASVCGTNIDTCLVRYYYHFYIGQRAKIPDSPVKYRTPGNPRMDGCMDRWMGWRIHGCMDSWMHGFMDAWIHGCMDSWMHEFMDAWIRGCMDGRIVLQQERASLVTQNLHCKWTDRILISLIYSSYLLSVFGQLHS